MSYSLIPTTLPPEVGDRCGPWAFILMIRRQKGTPRKEKKVTLLCSQSDLVEHMLVCNRREQLVCCVFRKCPSAHILCIRRQNNQYLIGTTRKYQCEYLHFLMEMKCNYIFCEYCVSHNLLCKLRGRKRLMLPYIQRE